MGTDNMQESIERKGVARVMERRGEGMKHRYEDGKKGKKLRSYKKYNGMKVWGEVKGVKGKELLKKYVKDSEGRRRATELTRWKEERSSLRIEI